MSKQWWILALIAVAAVLVANPQTPRSQQQQRPTKGVAVISPTEGNKVSGIVRFEQTDAGLHVTGQVSGLEPGSKHGFHVHEFGDMTVSDGTGMGGHYNPEGVEHGLPDKTMRHMGDMGNIQADANGVAKIDMTFPTMNLTGRGGSVLGRGVIVHASPDDGGQPTGNAGGRIGFGVIGVAKS